MKFKKEALQDLLCGESEDLTIISDELTDYGRWSLYFDLVFKDEGTGKFYRTTYSQGATENQDEQPFEHEDDEINCVEVHPVEKTVTVYEPVK